MNTAYKYRIYPNRKQREQIAQTFGCVRFVYNYYLSLRIDEYEFCNQYMSYYDCANNLTELKRIFSFLKDVDSIALQQSLRHLETAFGNFFKQTNVGYPKYKSKRSRSSYTTNCVNGNIKVFDKHIVLPKVGKVKAKIHRQVPDGYVLKSATVTQTASGKYYVSVLFEHESQVNEVVPHSFLGLDYSSPCLYIDSNGRELDYPRFYRKAEARLKREQRKLSHMKYRSNNWYKQKRRIAVIHEKIANQRKDFLHKLSYSLASSYDCIGIEDLNMRGMSQSLNLGKSTMDNGFGMFVTFLQYKLERRGKHLVKIDKWFPSTKSCHQCGCVKPMRLSDRQYVCPECGMVFDRDWNSAINIREEAKNIMNRRACGNSQLILGSLESLSGKPPLQTA